MRRIFRTITTKYMLIFMTLIVLTVVVLGTMIATILSNYAIDAKMEDLTTSNILFKSYYNEVDKENKDMEETFKSTEKTLSHILSVTFLTTEGCEVIAADKDGNLIMHACKAARGQPPLISYFSNEETSVEILNMQVIPAETLVDISADGNLSMNNNCNDLFDQQVIWNASTIYDEEREAVGYIISYAPLGGEEDLFGEMIKSIALTALWLLFVAIVAIYVVSYKVMTPLREISNAAKCFARGKFDVRVPVRGHDELADLAKSFNKMAIEIQGKDEMQKQFLSNASHDLRTPMTTIAGFIDGILDGAIPKEKQDYYLNIIKSEVQRLNRLVTSLLDISRLQSGERKFDQKPFNICELARQTIISFEAQFNKKNLDVEFDVDDYDMIALGDTDAINQVVYNLCHNAIKFSYENGKYRVSIKNFEDRIKFSVYNEGIGIAKEELPFVFDRFYKSDKSRGLDKTGVGLGLFISKAIIDAHNGDMTVNSEYEKWCEFSFTLARGDKNW